VSSATFFSSYRGPIDFEASIVAANRVLKYVKNLKKTVMPAQAGIQKSLILLSLLYWAPAWSSSRKGGVRGGVTVNFSTPC